MLVLKEITKISDAKRGQKLIWFGNRKKPITLRRMEYSVLYLLMSAKGKPLSENAISNALYGNDIRCDKLIQVTIATLRKKLGVVGSKIKRVYMFGYQISEKYLHEIEEQ